MVNNIWETLLLVEYPRKQKFDNSKLFVCLIILVGSYEVYDFCSIDILSNVYLGCSFLLVIHVNETDFCYKKKKKKDISNKVIMTTLKSVKLCNYIEKCSHSDC